MSRRLLNRCFLVGREARLELRYDFFRYLALEPENVSQFAVVLFRPDMRVGPGINQLCGDADAVL